MTLASNVSSVTLNGNGATTAFPFAFKVWKSADLEVSLTDFNGNNTVTTNWTVSLTDPGGTVTYPASGSPLPAGWKITIRRSMDFLQGVDLVSGSRFDAQVVETALDQATAERQQLLEELNRCYKVPVTESAPPSTATLAEIQTLTARVEAAVDKISYRTYDETPASPKQDFTLPFFVDAAKRNLAVFLSGVKQSNAGVQYLDDAGVVISSGAASKVRLAGIVSAGVPVEFVSTTDGTSDIFTALNMNTGWANVRDFGATGDGSTDDTAAIQAALNASKHVYFPDGTYRVSGTLTGRPNHSLIGTTPERCILLRDTAYGDTFAVGTTTPGQGAGAITIQGIWFYHIYTFNNGSGYVAGTSTNITNKNPTARHVAITVGQGARIRDCWFSGLGYGIEFNDTTVMWVERCRFNGMWDANVAGLQDTTASIHLKATIPGGNCGTFFCTDNVFGGYGAAAATNVTTGNVTVSKTLNAGPRYGLYIRTCERFEVGGNYFGGHSLHSLYIHPNGVTGHGTVHDNMFDSAAQYSIRVALADPAYTVTFLQIHNNTGVGYGVDQGFCYFQDTGNFACVAHAQISNNTIQYYLRAPIRIERTRGLTISGNNIAAYNTDGATNADPFVSAGLVVADSVHVHSFGNMYGGGVNDPTAVNKCQWGAFYYAITNNACGLERSAGLGLAGGSLVGGLSQTYPA